jgi:hypothetical protein
VLSYRKKAFPAWCRYDLFLSYKETMRSLPITQNATVPAVSSMSTWQFFPSNTNTFRKESAVVGLHCQRIASEWWLPRTPPRISETCTCARDKSFQLLLYANHYNVHELDTRRSLSSISKYLSQQWPPYMDRPSSSSSSSYFYSSSSLRFLVICFSRSMELYILSVLILSCALERTIETFSAWSTFQRNVTKAEQQNNDEMCKSVKDGRS